nr:restriction endonuclease subunit S [Brevibacillus sp. SYP-B805]
MEEALVPEEEQPYEVPENWTWVRIGSIYHFIGGGTPSKSNSSYWNGEIPWASVKDVKNKYLYSTQDSISTEGLENSSSSLAIPGDVLLVTRISPGKSTITKIKTAINQDLKIVRSILGIPSFFTWAYFTNNINVIENMSSGTTVKGVKLEELSRLPFPVPPMPEQKRIVDRVESLLEKINEAKRLIEAVTNLIQDFRQSVITRGCFGQLTAEWRNQNSVKTSANELLLQIIEEKKNIYSLQCLIEEGKKKKPRISKNINSIDFSTIKWSIPKEWVLTNLGTVIYDFQYGTSEKSEYNYNGVPVLRIPNISDMSLDFTDLKYLNSGVIEENNTVKNGDLLIIRSNGSRDLVGKTAIVENVNQVVAFASYLIRMRPVIVEPKYILYLLQTSRVKEQFFSKAKSSAGINNINTEELSSTVIPLPPLEEQKEIVRLIERQLKCIEELENQCKLGGQIIEQLPKTILNRAFRGELGINNPDEESAIEIIKETLSKQLC